MYKTNKTNLRLAALAVCLGILAGCKFQVIQRSDRRAKAGNPSTPGGHDTLSLSFDTASSSINEGESVDVKLSLSEPASTDITVSYTIAGTASTSEHSLTSGSIKIAAGQSSAVFSVTTTEDELDEVDETVVITLTSASGSELGDIVSHTITIVDDDGAPTVSFGLLSSPIVMEYDGSVSLSLQLSAPSAKNISLALDSSSSSAIEGSDFTIDNSTVTFLVGETSKNIEITLSDDNDQESNESISLSLSNLENATIGSSSNQKFTVLNNDFQSLSIKPSIFHQTEIPTGLQSRKVVTSPDGKFVYASSADNTIVAFSRSDSGTLTLIQALSSKVQYQLRSLNISGLYLVSRLTISPDGKNLYATAYRSLLVFDRNINNGELTLQQTFSDVGVGFGTEVEGLHSAAGMDVSPDGKNLYVTSSYDNALLAFDRSETSGALTFNEAFSDAGVGLGTAVDGLHGALEVKVSPDGKNAYVTGNDDSALLVFDRNETTGALSFKEVFSDVGVGLGTAVDGLGESDSLTLSPDGKNLYVISSADNAVISFDRNQTTGALTFNEAFSDAGVGIGTEIDGLENPTSIEMSPDGKSLYVAAANDDAIVFFDRDTTNGALTLNKVFSDVGRGIGTEIEGLDGASGLSVSPNGLNVFLVAFQDQTLSVFSRDQEAGSLIVSQQISNLKMSTGTGITGFKAPWDVVVSPDNRNLYVAGYFDDSLLVFDRDLDNGSLELKATFSDIGKGFGTEVDGLDGARGLSISPDGKSLYITGWSDDALLVFDRDTTTGALNFREAFSDVGVGIGTAIDGLDGANSVNVSPDGKNVYVVGMIDDSLLVFDRDESTGGLTFEEAFSDVGIGIGTAVQGLEAAMDVQVSYDNKNVYVTGHSDKTILVFDRNETTGALSFNEAFSDVGVGIGTAVEGLHGAQCLQISSDGKSVYVTGTTDDSLLVFDRNETTGTLSFREAFSDVGVGNGTEIEGLDGAWGIALSPDNSEVYVVANRDHVLLVFDRNQTTGALSLKETFSDPEKGIGTEVRGLLGAKSPVTSIDGHNLYIVAHNPARVLNHSLLVFDRH